MEKIKVRARNDNGKEWKNLAVACLFEKGWDDHVPGMGRSLGQVEPQASSTASWLSISDWAVMLTPISIPVLNIIPSSSINLKRLSEKQHKLLIAVQKLKAASHRLSVGIQG